MNPKKGRPEKLDNRTENEIKVYNLLDSLGVEFEHIDHFPAMTMEICEKIATVLGAPICKNLFLTNRQQTEFYLLLTPGSKRFKTKNLSAQIGAARLSFASPELMKQYLDLTPGSASIFGLMNDKEKAVQLIIDQDILKEDFIGCHPCVNTSSLKIKTYDMVNKILPYLHRSFITVTLPDEE